MLIMTGGDEILDASGTLTIFPLSKLNTTSISPVAETRQLPFRSLWGLDIHHQTGLFAITSNSHSCVVLTLQPTSEPAAHPAPATPPVFPQFSSVRVVQSSPVYKHTHRNNIPGVKISPDAKYLATASIDCTFALHRIANNKSLPLYQNDNPLYQTQDSQRETERCWQIQWLSHAIELQVCDADQVWVEWREQRRSGIWRVGDDFQCPESQRESLFKCLNYEELNIKSRDDYLLYDDDHPCEDSHTFAKRPQGNTPNCNGADLELPRQTSLSEHNLSNCKEDNTYDYPPWEKQNGQLMIVCREQSISLCRAISDPESPKQISSVQTLDTIRVVPEQRDQQLYTNVIEIPSLSLIIVSAIETGILLLRVLRPLSSMQVRIEGCEDFQSNPLLFLERVISADASVAGMCVVERKGDHASGDSFELWVLTYDMKIQCWDLSRGDLRVDISTCV